MSEIPKQEDGTYEWLLWNEQCKNIFYLAEHVFYSACARIATAEDSNSYVSSKGIA